MENNMQIFVNNQLVDTTATTIADLANELSLPSRGVAIASNNRVIPQTMWHSTNLSPNDHITVIKAAFGG